MDSQWALSGIFLALYIFRIKVKYVFCLPNHQYDPVEFLKMDVFRGGKGCCPSRASNMENRFIWNIIVMSHLPFLRMSLNVLKKTEGGRHLVSPRLPTTLLAHSFTSIEFCTQEAIRWCMNFDHFYKEITFYKSRINSNIFYYFCLYQHWKL